MCLFFSKGTMQMYRIRDTLNERKSKKVVVFTTLKGVIG